MCCCLWSFPGIVDKKKNVVYYYHIILVLGDRCDGIWPDITLCKSRQSACTNSLFMYVTAQLSCVLYEKMWTCRSDVKWSSKLKTDCVVEIVLVCMSFCVWESGRLWQVCGQTPWWHCHERWCRQLACNCSSQQLSSEKWTDSSAASAQRTNPAPFRFSNPPAIRDWDLLVSAGSLGAHSSPGFLPIIP